MKKSETDAWWAIQKFGKLRIKTPIDVSIGSHRKVFFVCECGKEINTIIKDVTSGATHSCGKCSEKPPEWWEKQKFGRLRLAIPRMLQTGSSQKALWFCDCGKRKNIIIKDVTSGKTTSCNICNEMPESWWASQKFGRLRLLKPKLLNRWSKKKEIFKCDCGSEKSQSVQSVTSGAARSCGKCYQKVWAWYSTNRTAIRALKAPIKSEAFPSGGITPIETILLASKPFRALCPICKREYKPRLSSIRLGHSLTCGCSASQVSGPNLEIYEFVLCAGFKAQLEYVISGYKYDVFVMDSKTVIEFNGTRYHASESQVARDQRKKALAEIYGYELISISEKNWRSNKEKEKSDILTALENRRSAHHNFSTKNEIVARLQELESLNELLPDQIKKVVAQRIDGLKKEAKHANEDIISAAISSHHIMCKVKNMRPDEAFGNDPFIYYALGLVGEAGELTGALLRSIRNGGGSTAKKIAVESELADCLIYAIILAYSTGIDLVKIVNEKARIVEDRARSGYYGPALR